MYVCMYVTTVSQAKEDEPIEMTFGCVLEGSSNHHWVRARIPPREWHFWGIVASEEQAR